MSNSRKKYTHNEELILFNEVDGICPLDSRQLTYQKTASLFKGFEIAHIYPLNPTQEERLLLQDEERLSKDPNALENVICLCTNCHGIYDKPRTVEEYRKLLTIKKKIIAETKQRVLWQPSQLENDLIQVIDHLANIDFEDIEGDILEYDPKTIDKKVNSTITPLVKRKIHQNVESFYHVVKNKFVELDKLQPTTTEIISSQIKTFYLKLAQDEMDQKKIFDGVTKWIQRKTNNDSTEACEIITSYFIQNCEVFK